MNGAPDAPAPLFTIRPGRGWAAVDWREIVAFRDLLTTLSIRDLKLRYKQTALGVIWVVLQPLMAAGVFSFVFGMVAKMPSDGRPYFLFSYAGLLGWNLFNNTVTKAGGSLTGNTALISKVYFPRLILPLSSVPSVLVDFAAAAVMMGVAMAFYHVAPPATIVFVPLLCVLLLLLSLGIGLITSALSVPYRDVQYILPVFIQILLYASPIAYSSKAVPANMQAAYNLNPLSAPLEAFRSTLLGTPMPATGALVYASVFSVVAFFIGVYSFKRMERKFADVI